MMKISSLQSRLDEQRLCAEETHRQRTSDLNIRLHDLQVCTPLIIIVTRKLIYFYISRMK